MNGGITLFSGWLSFVCLNCILLYFYDRRVENRRKQNYNCERHTIPAYLKYSQYFAEYDIPYEAVMAFYLYYTPS